MESSTIELITTQKGKPCLIVDNYQHRLYRKNSEIITWVCAKEKQLMCKGRIKTSHQYEILSKTPHSCEANVAEIEIKKKLLKCRKRVREEVTVPVNKIFREEMSEIYARNYDFLAKIPSYENAKSTLCLERRKVLRTTQNTQYSMDISMDPFIDCPGVKSENAGKAEACAGCPNQNICSSTKSQEPDPDLDLIKEKMASVKHIILVLSGKGGVGKSTFTSMLAQTLAEDSTKNIGVMDIDLCGPSMPRILGVENEQVHLSGSGWSPIFVEENLCLMSIAFLLSGPEEAVIWRGPKKNGLIKQFLKDVDWGDLDYLVIDTPPGTSDEHMSIVQFLEDTNLAGAVIVTTPQETALLDVRKEINFCQKVKLPILGVVENMSFFVCPKCKVSSEIFPPTTGGAEKMAQEIGVPFLGKLPLNPEIGKICDQGQLVVDNNEFPAKTNLKDISSKILTNIDVYANTVQ